MSRPSGRIAASPPVGTVKFDELAVDRDELRALDERVALARRDDADGRRPARRSLGIGSSPSVVPTNVLPVVLVDEQQHEVRRPRRAPAPSGTSCRSPAGASELPLIAVDRLGLREDVARRVVRERDVDRVEDRDHLERDQEDRSRDQELERAAPARRAGRPRRSTSVVDDEDGDGDPLLLAGEDTTAAQTASALTHGEQDDLERRGRPAPRRPRRRRDGNARIDCATAARWGGGSARTAVVLNALLRSERRRWAPVAGRPSVASADRHQPILFAMLRAAVVNVGRAGVAPVPFVDFDPGTAELLPDGRHLRDVRHRDAAGAGRAELRQDGVVDALAGDRVRRVAAVRRRERALRRAGSMM